MFYAKLFKNTGYNLVNVPDSIQKLEEEYAGVDYPALDILQLYHQTKISLKVANGESDVVDADFLLLANNNVFSGRVAAYKINSYTFTSGDVVDLDVSMEPFITCGGVDNIEFLDGMTTRHHVPVNDDLWGKYVEDDPMLIPSRPPEVEYLGTYFCEKDTSSLLRPHGIMLVECVNEVTGDFKINNAYDLAISNDGTLIDGITGNGYTGPEISNWETTPPDIVVPVDHEAGVTGNNTGASTNAMGTMSTYFVRSDFEQTSTGSVLSAFIGKLKTLFEWNITNIIKNAWLIPLFWRYNGSTFEFVDDNNAKKKGLLSKIESVPLKVRGPHILENADTLQDFNIRAYEGSANQYFMIATGTGETQIKKPEELQGILDEGALTNYTGPTVSVVANNNIETARVCLYGWADLRAGGCPKFHILSKDDAKAGSNRGYYFKDFIKGQIWGSVPIGLNATVGAGQAAINYSENKIVQDKMTMLNATKGLYQDSTIQEGSLLGAIGQIKPTIGDFFNNVKAGDAYAREQRRYLGEVGAFGSASIDQMIDWSNGARKGSERAAAYAQREMQARAEALQYVVTQVPQPQIAYSGSDNVDPAGNGIILYKMVPNIADATKYQKVLNQYGYRVTEPMKKSFLTNRPHYNYIQAVSVSCQANGLPKSVVDDLAVAFSQGLRIWHRKPDPSIYDTTVNKTGAAYNDYDPSQHGWVQPT